MGCHFLLQGIFPTQGLNPYLLHWQADSLPLSHPRSPLKNGRHVFFNFLAEPCVMWDLSSLTRDRSHAPRSGSLES